MSSPEKFDVDPAQVPPIIDRLLDEATAAAETRYGEWYERRKAWQQEHPGLGSIPDCLDEKLQQRGEGRDFSAGAAFGAQMALEAVVELISGSEQPG